MLKNLRTLALATAPILGLSALLSAQDPNQGGDGREAIYISDAQIQPLNVADVVAKRDGVVESIEMREGTEVKKGQPIGYLDSSLAKLTCAKAKVQFEALAAIQSAEAYYELAVAKIARTQRLIEKIGGDAVSKEKLDEERAEAKVASAKKVEAQENKKLAKAELDLATQVLDEHAITAPFDGEVVEVHKKPGDGVRALDPVVRLLNKDILRIFAYVPYEQSFLLRVGDEIEVEPNLPRTIRANQRTKFKGKITFIDPEIQPVGEKARRIFAEIDNKSHGYALNPGMNATLIIYPNTAQIRTSANVSAPKPAVAPAGTKARGN